MLVNLIIILSIFLSFLLSICIYLGEWTTRIIHLLNDNHIGVVTAAVSLIDALVKKNPDEYKADSDPSNHKQPQIFPCLIVHF